MTTQRLSLGEMLKDNLVQRKAKNDDVKSFSVVNDELVKEKHVRLTSFFDDAKRQICDDIQSGNWVIQVVTRYTEFQYGELFHSPNACGESSITISNQTSPFNDIWEDFKRWLGENNLRFNLYKAYDGLGTESWLVINITINF